MHFETTRSNARLDSLSKANARGSILDDEGRKFLRLFSIYQTAKDDFQHCSAGTLKYTKSARFLRDTIENCLAHLSPCHKTLINELQSVLSMAMAAAEESSGGRKRPFDEGFKENLEILITRKPSKINHHLYQPEQRSERRFHSHGYTHNSLALEVQARAHPTNTGSSPCAGITKRSAYSSRHGAADQSRGVLTPIKRNIQRTRNLPWGQADCYRPSWYT